MNIDTFWLNNPRVLFQHEKIHKIWPYHNMTFYEKLNASTRFIIFLTIFGYIFIPNISIVLIGVIMICTLILIYNRFKNSVNIENMKNINCYPNKEPIVEKKNPMGNFLVSDYKDNINKKTNQQEYNEDVESQINETTKNMILDVNKNNEDRNKLFDNLGDDFNFEKSMRQFYTNSSTSMPSNMEGFLNFCFGKLPSEKPLNIY